MLYKNAKCKGNDKVFDLYKETSNELYLSLYTRGWCTGDGEAMEEVRYLVSNDFEGLKWEEENDKLSKELGII